MSIPAPDPVPVPVPVPVYTIPQFNSNRKRPAIEMSKHASKKLKENEGFIASMEKEQQPHIAAALWICSLIEKSRGVRELCDHFFSDCYMLKDAVKGEGEEEKSEEMKKSERFEVFVATCAAIIGLAFADDRQDETNAIAIDAHCKLSSADTKEIEFALAEHNKVDKCLEKFGLLQHFRRGGIYDEIYKKLGDEAADTFLSTPSESNNFKPYDLKTIEGKRYFHAFILDKPAMLHSNQIYTDIIAFKRNFETMKSTHTHYPMLTRNTKKIHVSLDMTLGSVARNPGPLEAIKKARKERKRDGDEDGEEESGSKPDEEMRS
jgi:hypothetical protein